MTEHPINLGELEDRLNGHSVFAPSASAMWMTCSGSLIPNLLAVDSAGLDAATGTVAHDVHEQWLRSGYRPDDRIGETMIVAEREETFEIEIDEEMMSYVGDSVAYCLALGGDPYVEIRVDFSDLTPIPNQGGRSDYIAARRHHLDVADLKYGIGIKVFAENNSQALLYAYGAFRAYDWFYDFQTITIHICQPRLDHFDSWTITREQLLQFAQYASERAHAAWVPNAPRKPSPKGCLWCRVKSTCAANAVMADRLLDGVFPNLEDEVEIEDEERLKQELDEGFYYRRKSDPRGLTTDQMAELLPYRSYMESWFKALDEELETRALAGIKVPGYKLVESRTNRQFRSVPQAQKVLRKLGLTVDEIQPRGEISPNQAEVLLIKKKLVARADIPETMDGLWIKPKGRPTLVPLNDKRPTIESAIDDVFPNLEDDEL